MAPAFLKSLRRRSRASFRTDRSTDDSSEGAFSNGTGPSSGLATPASTAHQSDPALDLQVSKEPAPSSQNAQSPVLRPPLAPVANTKRHSSSSGMSGLGSPSVRGRSNLPLSPYAPMILNVSENAWVYQKMLLVHGSIGDPSQHSVSGTLTVTRADDSAPPVSWPVCDSHFKCLLYLQPGPNRIRFDFSSPALPNSTSSNPIHASYLTVHMLPNTSAPPLQLVILLGKDSPGTYDAPPARAEKEGNGLDMAIRKYRMAAYLWQAYTAEQMFRNKLGRRVFRFEEEWIPGTANYRDLEHGTMRSEARVHVVRSDKTVAELRDLDKAQQYEQATDKNALFGIAADALQKHFNPISGQQMYCAVLLLDAQWDKENQTIRGHAALGGSHGELNLAIFGSHCLHSYPAAMEDVAPAFIDCTQTDTKYVANDCGDAGSSWEAANIGIGAHLHEVGHLFGCPHQAGGVMLRDYVVLNRSFVPREAYSTRTKSKGGFCRRQDECEWHRLDCLRFKSHPAFKLPNDPPPIHADASVQAYAVEDGKVFIMAATGISVVEVFAEGDDVCRTWNEYLISDGLMKQVTLTEQELRWRLPDAKKRAKIKILMRSHGGGELEIDDLRTFCSKGSHIKLEGGGMAFPSKQLGHSKMDGSEPQQVIFTSMTCQERVMSKVVVYHGMAVDGVQFFYDDDSSQLFGSKGNNHGDVFEFDVRKGEYLTGLFVRAGFWIDAIQILSSLGRSSPVFGKAHGGDAHTLLPPRGYRICGLSGSCGAWLDGLSVLVKR